MLFVVSEDLSNIERIESQSFVSLKIWERTHIQEWVRKHPDMLGEDLLIVNMEFDRFEGSRDRLDLLALDRSGNLVVVELKRDSFAGHADLQTIRYAAMISTMTVEQLLERYADYHKRTTGEEASEERLRSIIKDFVELEDFEELSSRPRIILCSEDFSQEITTTVLWLRGFDLDISCVRLTPHRSDNKLILVPEKIIPLRESEEYITRVQQKEEQRQESKREDPGVAKVIEILTDLGRNESRLEVDSIGKNKIRVAVQEWDTDVLLQGNGFGRHRRVLMFEFRISSDSLDLILIVGPGPQETRKKLFEIAQAHPEVFEIAHQKLGGKWNRIFYRTFLGQEMYLNTTDEERKQEILRQWTAFLDEDLPRIDEILKGEAWIWESVEADG